MYEHFSLLLSLSLPAEVDFHLFFSDNLFDYRT